MTSPHAMTLRVLTLAITLLLVGCGPTRTSGTGGKSAQELAVLSIPQLPKESPIQIRTIQFDGKGDAYKVGKGRDFYLTPSDHTASFTLEAIIPKDASYLDWMIPKDARIIPGPKNIPLGTMSAGKTYELAPPFENFDKLMETGELSLVREKRKEK